MVDCGREVRSERLSERERYKGRIEKNRLQLSAISDHHFDEHHFLPLSRAFLTRRRRRRRRLKLNLEALLSCLLSCPVLFEPNKSVQQRRSVSDVVVRRRSCCWQPCRCRAPISGVLLLRLQLSSVPHNEPDWRTNANTNTNAEHEETSVETLKTAAQQTAGCLLCFTSAACRRLLDI